MMVLSFRIHEKGRIPPHALLSVPTSKQPAQFVLSNIREELRWEFIQK